MSVPAPLPCVTCHSRCCTYTVAITSMDAVRMQRELGRPAAEFTRLTEHDPDRVGFRLRPGGPRFRMVLAKQDSGELRDWCTFFRPGNAAGGCSIYQARPMPCRMFPATLTLGRVGLRVPAPCPDGAWGPRTALWGASWQATAGRTVTEQLLDFAMNVAWNRMVDRDPGTKPGDTAAAMEVGAGPGATAHDYATYLNWMDAIYRAIDRHTGCLDRRGQIDPATIVAMKSLLRP